MKVAGIREFRARCASLLGAGEPLLVTRHGKVSGLYLPLEDPDRIPEDLRKEMARVLGRHLAKLLHEKGVTERGMQEDFHAHRRRRR